MQLEIELFNCIQVTVVTDHMAHSSLTHISIRIIR